MSGAKDLVGAWTENTSWLKLNYCTKMKDNEAIALASAMQHNTSWKVLDFHGSTFGFDGAAALAAALEGHERWQYVIIKITLIKENEIKRIAQYLRQPKDWERFVLHYSFSDSHRAKVVEAIISRPKARAWKSLVLWFSFMSYDKEEALAQQLIILFSQTNASSSDVLITNKEAALTMNLNDFLGKSWQDTKIYYFDGQKIYSKTEEEIFSSMKSPPLSNEETTSVAQSSAQESTSSKFPSVAVSHIQAEPSSSKNFGEAASLEPAGAPKSPLNDLQIDLPTQMDEGGMTPLHLVCRDASTFNVQEVKAAIQDAPWLLRRRNLDGSTPLHVLCSNNPPLSAVELLVESWESYILIENMYGWLPIHCACAHRASLEVVEFLAKKDEQMVESSSRTVLRETYGQNNNVFHLACDNAMPNDGSDTNLRPSHDPSLRVVQFLVGLARELALRKNSTGDLPIDMARRAKAFDIVKFLENEFSELVDSHEKKKESKTNLTEYVDIEYMRASISQLHTNGDVAVSDHVWTSTREKLDELGSAAAVSCETAKDASGIAMSMAHEWVNFQPERRGVICIDASNEKTLLRDYNVVIRSFLKTQPPTSGGDLFEDEKDAADQLLEILDSIPAAAQFHWLVLFQNCPDKTPVEMWFFSNNSYWWNSRASFLFAISNDGAANLARGLDGIWVVDGVTGQSQLLSSTA